MLRGVTTVVYTAEDVPAAMAWYTTVFGIEPYFVREAAGVPAYVEFRVGDYLHEFGILDRRFAPAAGPSEPGGVITYWAVDDLMGSFARLLALGATVYEEPTERGPGYVTASVVDPFGNVLGVMYNVHYLEVVGTRAPAATG
jgi:predicted enzyme related to lactoylglutathione lyase